MKNVDNALGALRDVFSAIFPDNDDSENLMLLIAIHRLIEATIKDREEAADAELVRYVEEMNRIVENG